jgi:hypothetical protein
MRQENALFGETMAQTLLSGIAREILIWMDGKADASSLRTHNCCYKEK